MDTTGQTFSPWMFFPVREFPPLPASTRADVCVIGAGIAGLTTAYLLARDGHAVTVLDDGTPGCGQTGVTTAHLSSAIDDGYEEMIRLHGVHGARLAHQSHRAAIERVEAICDLEEIHCDFLRVSGYLFLGPEHDEQDLAREFGAAQQAAAQVEWLPRMPENGLKVGGPCLHFPRQGQFHPLKYLRGLAEAFERAGGRLFTGTHAEVVEGGDGARVTTSDGRIVHAESIVVATNGPINDLVTIHTNQAPYHTYVIGARVKTGAVATALYWDTQDPYHYVRLQRVTNRDLGGDNDDVVDIVIVGGEDHKAAQASDGEARFERLAAWTREHVPGAGVVEFRWSGQVMETQDGLGFIGRNPMDASNVFVVTGDSGMGMTHGTIAGVLISDLIAGRENPWVALYDAGRISRGCRRRLPQREPQRGGAVRRVDHGGRGELGRPDRAEQRRGDTGRRDESGRLSRRVRHAPSILRRLPSPRLYRRMERRGLDVGLSVPRLAVRSPWRRDQRARERRPADSLTTEQCTRASGRPGYLRGMACAGGSPLRRDLMR